MRSHSFADSTSRVTNSNRAAFQRRNTIDIIDNQTTLRQTSSSSTDEERALSTISSTADLSFLSLHCNSASNTENQAIETAAVADATEEHHERTQCNIRQLTHQFSMSCANPWTDDFIAPDYHANDSHSVTLPTLMHHLQSVMGDGITHAEVGEVFFELLKDKKQNPVTENDDLEELAPCVFREDDLRERFCNIVRSVCIDELRS